jgi:hypothetical protein
VRFIRRFRLEKEDPSAELSDPIKPIEFWIDRATPEWLIPWVERGVDRVAARLRGGRLHERHRGRHPPTPEEDPSWSPHDARHSMIYWRRPTTQNATGGNVPDPRTGEILKADVNMYHNVMNLVRNWYFVQAGPLDPRAQQFPMPDSIIGAMVEYVVAHEVGHAIGFPHNFKASAMYPADSIRSREFLEEKGSHVATLMDYSRLNYVAQPEDNIPPELLIPKVGPYDKYAIMWGAQADPRCHHARGGVGDAGQLVAHAGHDPLVPVHDVGSLERPHAVTEAVGNDDAVKSSSLGMRNLERVMDMLLDVAEKPGEDYSLLQELYSNTVSQWGRYNNHVAAIIGGAYTQERYGTGERFTPVERDQAAGGDAVPGRERLHRAGNVPGPGHPAAPRVRWRGEPVLELAGRSLQRADQRGATQPTGRVRGARERLRALHGGDFLGDLRAGRLGRALEPNPQVDVFRRSLQRTFVNAMDEYLNPEVSAPFRMRGPSCARRWPSSPARPCGPRRRARDRMTQLHLQEMEREIRGSWRTIDDATGQVPARATPAHSPSRQVR